MNILITGKNSYIGNNICKFLLSKGHNAKTVSIRNGIDNIDLTNIDTIIHCAAIVHKKEKEYANDYDKINHKLTIKLAEKAKSKGVKHFIFMSTMSVYGNKAEIININTPLSPVTLYGKTKLMAEYDLQKLNDNTFTITIIRPPMIYGKGCPGNYKKLSALAKKTHIFPDTDNLKSMLYVVNLSFFVTNLTENKIGGIYMPMDNKYVSTGYMAKNINNKIKLSKFLGKIISIIKINMIKKAFGTLYYDESCATKINYIEFEKAIEYTEN
jgi:NAD-dependent epimerase/dehydratase